MNVVLNWTKSWRSAIAALVPVAFFFLSPFVRAEIPSTPKVQQEHLRDFDAVTLRLPYLHQFQFAGYYAAIEKGYYASEGLEVTILEGNKEETPVEAVAGGRAQFGITGSELVVERLRGKPVVSLAVIFQHSPYALICDARRGIRHPSDLVGKRVMMELNQRDVEFLAMFKKLGIDVSHILVRRNSWEIDDLANGTVDAMGCYVTDKPFQCKKRNLPYTMIQPAQYGIDFYGDCLFTSEYETQFNRYRVEAFRRASLRGWNYAMDHPDEMISVILNKYGARNRGLTREDLNFEYDEMRKLIVPELVPIGQMHPDRWAHIAESYASLGLAPRPVNLDGFLFESHEAENEHWLSWLRLALFTTVVVAMVVILWNMQLRRQVEKRTELLRHQNTEISREAEALRKAKEDLRASEAKFRRIYDANIVGMFYANSQGDLLDANDAFLKLIGYSREEMRDGFVQQQVFSDSESHPLPPEALQEIRRTGLCGPYEKDMISRQGAHIPSIIGAAVVTAKDNSIIAIVQDISEKKRLLEEQIKASKLEAIGVLAGGIAHDFNNLLTPILGNLSLARNTSENTPGIDGFLQLAEKACWRARDLTQQLLTFSRGGAPVKTSAILPDLIRDSTLFALHGSNVRALFEIAPDLSPVEADQGQLSQVLQNLVINAIHAMPHGGAITIRAQNVNRIDHPRLPSHTGKYVRVEVIDEGTGIPPENLKKIFDPYFTTKPHGHGLGLATTFSIIRRHEGHIGVQSEMGKGSTFSIYLPVSREVVKPRPVEATMVNVASAGARILVMDDEEGIQQLVKDMLTRPGYTVTVVGSGEAAVKAYLSARHENRPFDVVILDLTVPGGMGGAETLEILRENDPDVRAIVCSGYSNDPVVAEYAKYHFRAAVNKPFAYDQLMSTIATVLAQS